MQIDRSNYEIWIIDWLDGNLSGLQVEQLEQFLYVNPDLYEELEDLKTFIIKPSSKSFPQKEQLKRSSSDISSAQFEYLCIASLENDLNRDQQSEMMEIIGSDPKKKRSYELLKKIRLVPGTDIYKHSKKLLKRTLAQKVIRLTVVGLAVAATVTIIILTNIVIPRNRQDTRPITAHSIMSDSTLSEPSVSNVPVITRPVKNPDISKQINIKRVATIQKNNSFSNRPDLLSPVPTDSAARISHAHEVLPVTVPVFAVAVLKEGNRSNILVASGYNFIPTVYDDDGNRLGRFIARTFRERILKEPPSADTPLKAYEIAEAGVTGLNKLLGWEMALDEKKDENGELRSVSFNSRILKFNAPVRKTEPLP
jgi:hypothetical protein